MEGNELLNGLDGRKLKRTISYCALGLSFCLVVAAFLINSLVCLALGIWVFAAWLSFALVCR